MFILSRAGFASLLALPLAMTLLYGGVHQPVLALFYLAVAGMVIVWATDSWMSGKVIFSKSYLQIPLLSLGFYALIQTIPFCHGSDQTGIDGIARTISADPFATKLAGIQILACAFYFSIALVELNTAKRLRRVIATLTVFGFGYAFFAVLQSLLSPEAIFGIYKPFQGAPFGSFVNRNDFAALMVLLVSLPLGMLFSGNLEKDKRLLYAVAVAMMGTSILLSQSRGGFVAFLAEIILVIIFTRQGRKNLFLKLGLSMLLVVAAVAGAVFVGGETSLGRLGSKDAALEAPTESTSRTHIWVVTVKMIADNMPLGVGLGAYPAVYPQYDTASGFERVEQAHNDYLQLVSDAGVPGILLGVWFLYLLWKCASDALRVDNPYRRSIVAGSLAGIVAVLLHSLFDFVLHISAVELVFLLLLALVVAAQRSYEDDEDEVVVNRRHRSRISTPR